MSASTCTACGFANPAGAFFCGNCGNALGRPCPSCGTLATRELAFCTTCGAALVDLSEAVTAEERKTVSVLFADLVGFTTRAEELDPEDVGGLQTPYYVRVKKEIENFGGTVEKFIGDAVMAVFGAPVAHEDDPTRAMLAALAIRDALAELNVDDPGLQLRIRIAVTTGEALVRIGARPDKGEGIAAGDVVNTAARLQAAAPVDGILADEATWRASQHLIEYRAAEPVQAKGKAEPVPAWEAVSRIARFGVDIAFRGGAPLVGRQEELAALRDAMARAMRGRGPQLVTLVGAPGLGKSRLVWELYEAVHTDPDLLVAWRQGRSLPYGEGVAFWALGEMTKAQAGILESDDAKVAETKLRAAVETVVQDETEARWVEGHLRPLTGLGGAGEAGPEARNEAFAAWRRFFEAIAEGYPLVLVFEDLHWADDGLLDFIDYLTDWAGDVPLVLVCTARPELLDRRLWGGGKRNATTISLGPLSDSETDLLLGSLLDNGLLSPERRRQLLARAGGNPLYAEEYVRMLAQAREELPLPETVHGIITARLDTLPGDEKALLHAAAIVGKVFWVGALAAALGIARDEVERGLNALSRREFVRRERRSSVAGETAYVFRHVLVRDVAYGQIPRARRAESHRSIAEWLESLAFDRPEDLADMVAHHYSTALAFTPASDLPHDDLADSARRALRDAGDRSLSLSAFPAAARFYREALALWPFDAERARLLLGLGRALFHSEAGGADVLSEAAADLRRLGDVEEAAEAELLLGEIHFGEGRRDQAFTDLHRAIDLLSAEPLSRAKATVFSTLSRFLMIADEAEEAIRVGRQALEMADALELQELRAHVLVSLGVARVSTGDLGGIGDLELGIAIAEDVNPLESIRGYLNLGSIYAHLGQLHRGFELHARGRERAERLGDATRIAWLRTEFAYEHYWRGQWVDALELAEELVAAGPESGPHRIEIDGRLVRAWIRLANGELEGARDDAGKALAFAREAKDPQALFPALALSAHVALACGQEEDARAHVLELLDAWGEQDATLPSYWTADLAVSVQGLGDGSLFLATASRARMQTAWLEAACAVASGEFGRAANLYATIGSAPDEASARLRAGETLLADGRRAKTFAASGVGV
jgi:class 3 adenylate cyclase/tetratricopeptide (TPR) repeat protein